MDTSLCMAFVLMFYKLYFLLDWYDVLDVIWV